jgi:hypothetical protein
MRGCLIAALGAVFVIAAAPAAQADVQPYATNYAGGFHDVLPPGANGMANGVELAAFQTTGTRPAHNDDQIAMYRDLMYATPGLKADDLEHYYKDSTFGHGAALDLPARGRLGRGLQPATISARPTRRASTATCSRTSSASFTARSSRSTPSPSAATGGWQRAARPSSPH